MEIHFKGNSRIFLIAFFGLLLVCSSYLIFFFDPLQAIVKKMVIISDGSVSFKLFKDPPYTIYLKMYVFNVTNADEFIAGKAKLKFQEIGPYIYQEILTNEDAKFYDNGTMSYVPRRSVKFLRELSVGDPKEDTVLVPNVPLLGITSMLHQSSMFLNLAVLSICRVVNAKPILNLTVEDYFWGYEDPLVHMASSVLPNWISFQKFGILDRMYDEGNNTVTIVVDPSKKVPGSPLLDEEERGRLYSIHKWNGNPGLSHWGYKQAADEETVEGNSKCNMLEGAYDGSIFPINLKEGSKFRVYRKFFCRTMPIEFEKKSVTEDNFNAFHYKVSDNFLFRREDNPDNECYCKDKNFCLPNGLGDATPCYYGFPAAVSRPHFLRTDPSVFDKIEGLSPDEEKHGTAVMISPELGLVMKGYSKMQVNLVMWQTKYNARTAPFNNMVIPLFWSEMSVKEVPSSIHLLMTLALKVGPITQVVFMYLFAIVGASLIATAGILVFLSVSPHVTQRSPSISLGYSPIRMIPVIRRESWIRDIRRMNRQNSRLIDSRVETRVDPRT